jgi:hypothetical protein
MTAAARAEMAIQLRMSSAARRRTRASNEPIAAPREQKRRGTGGRATSIQEVRLAPIVELTRCGASVGSAQTEARRYRSRDAAPAKS